MLENKQSSVLIENVKASYAEHKKWGSWDAWLYNGGTGVVLLCTTLATFIPSAETSISTWLPQILTAFATFWVALDRALTFGLRWRFHLTQKSGYRRILDKIDYHSSLPEKNRDEYMSQIVVQLDLIRSQESDMPGIGVNK